MEDNERVQKFGAKQTERMQWFSERYDDIANGVLAPGGRIYLGDKTNRQCRYCGKTRPAVKFQKVAHAFPEQLGNKTLLDHLECDTCNEHFSTMLEDDFAKWTMPLRSPVQGSEHYSPLSSILRPLITTQTNELVVMALLVTVTVEGVLHLEFPHLRARPPSLLEQIASAKKLVRRLKNVEDTFRTRINNALDNMARLRTSDKLKDLRKHGVISKQMIDAWQSLRNASTHATIDPKVFNNERLWHDGYTVAMMLHLILFTAIGYSGRYMDFSVTGWPEKEFLTPTLDSVNAETSTNVEAASPT